MILLVEIHDVDISPSPSYCKPPLAYENTGQSSSESQGNTPRKRLARSPHRENTASAAADTFQRWISQYEIDSTSDSYLIMRHRVIKKVANGIAVYEISCQLYHPSTWGQDPLRKPSAPSDTRPDPRSCKGKSTRAR
jgi:hypothetical protein